MDVSTGIFLVDGGIEVVSLALSRGFLRPNSDGQKLNGNLESNIS